MTAAAGLRGLDLLDAVIAHIEAHPETWDQTVYRCETVMCVAGWAAQLAGGEWLRSDGEWPADVLLAEPGDPPELTSACEGHACVEAFDRAVRLLGLEEYQADALFAGGNSLADVKRLRDALRAERAS